MALMWDKRNKFITSFVEKTAGEKRVLKTERQRKENNPEYPLGWQWNAMIKTGLSQKRENEK